MNSLAHSSKCETLLFNWRAASVALGPVLEGPPNCIMFARELNIGSWWSHMYNISVCGHT